MRVLTVTPATKCIDSYCIVAIDTSIDLSRKHTDCRARGNLATNYKLVAGFNGAKGALKQSTPATRGGGVVKKQAKVFARQGRARGWGCRFPYVAENPTASDVYSGDVYFPLPAAC